MFQTQIIKKQLHFKQPAGTSRGVYTTRNVWYILLTDTGSRHYGVGECAIHSGWYILLWKYLPVA